ncbi:transmembrane protein 176A isoform X2 [Choloepus didactylus]|uniref:transmembrane protein 176A isoform X2 n=1 Tax=Choloepus didactylus TaxID=27675 RepID=UPI0018A0F99B|nr:transmembrane protein 176A isoform X2 [Choloepus didactylus]
MATDMGPADGGEAVPAAPQPTHIDVHIHQESVLAKLLLSGCSLLRTRARPRDASSEAAGRRLLAASWVVQIVLGVLSGVLGGFLYLFPYSYLLASGAAIWTGAVAVLAGVVAFTHEKRGGMCWGLLRTLLALAAFSTAVAAITIWADWYHGYPFYNEDYVCGSSSEGWPTLPPSTKSPEEVRRLSLCLSYIDMLRTLYKGLWALLLSVWIVLLVASLVPLGLYCWRILLPKKEKDRKELLEVESSPASF